MRARVVKESEVLGVADLLRARGYDVKAPFAGPGRDSYFDDVTDSNRSLVRLHVPNPFYPPKRYLLPPIERMMSFKRGGDEGLTIEEAREGRRVAIFGVRSCDLAGIGHLDRFFLEGEFGDAYYRRRRGNLFLVNVVCTDVGVDVGEECFCVCADTGPAAREHFDLQLMDLGEGEWMAVAGTAAGDALFDAAIFGRATARHVERRRAILGDVRQRLKKTTSWFPATVRYVSEGKVLEGTWEEIGNRCLECGGCTYVCPACTCFTVTDRALGETETVRERVWDSCALAGFTRMAGGFNPRKAVHDRRNRRFFRKLAHHFIRREGSMACVGCGRCVAVCHGDIGMPSVVEMLRRATAELDERERQAQHAQVVD